MGGYGAYWPFGVFGWVGELPWLAFVAWANVRVGAVGWHFDDVGQCVGL